METHEHEPFGPSHDNPEWYSYYTESGFEFDPAKSAANELKHGIDFVEAQALWKDEQRYDLPMRSSGEARMGIVAQINTVLWTSVYTIRGDRIRIISVRRARHDERKLYEQGRQDHDGGGVRPSL